MPELLFRLARLEPDAGAAEEARALLSGPEAMAGPGGALVRAAVANGVAPLVYRHLPKGAGVSREAIQELFKPYHANVRWNKVALAELTRLLQALRGAGLDAVPLKGAVGALSLLGDAGLYAGSDVDLLVRRENLEEAIGVLRSLGYSDSHVPLAVSLGASCHHCLGCGGFQVEVHWTLVQPPFVGDAEFWWEDATPCATPAGAAFSLAVEKHLLYLVYRLYVRGFTPLRFFMLPAQIASGRAGAVDWRRFAELARHCRMERAAQFTMAFLKDLLGAEVPEEVAAPGRRHERLRRRIAAALLGGPPITQTTRLRLFWLFDHPDQALQMVVRWVLPSAAQVRWRYGVRRGGWRLVLLYLANPALVFLDLDDRERFSRGLGARPLSGGAG